MCFIAIRKNKIIAKIYEFAVYWKPCIKQAKKDMLPFQELWLSL